MRYVPVGRGGVRPGFVIPAGYAAPSRPFPGTARFTAPRGEARWDRTGQGGTGRDRGQDTVVEAVGPTGSGSGSSSSAADGFRPSQRPATVTAAVIAM